MTAALFLDRDGVINIEKNYVHKVEDFEFVPGIFELCQAALDQSYLIFVVTNQAGIGRGYYTVEQFEHLTCWMLAEFEARDITISKVYHCPYHPDAGIGDYKRDSYDRKPNPGMILSAEKEFSVDLKNSILIGDKLSDIQAANNAGLSTALLLSDSGCNNSSDERCLHARDLPAARAILFNM